MAKKKKNVDNTMKKIYIRKKKKNEELQLKNVNNYGLGGISVKTELTRNPLFVPVN